MSAIADKSATTSAEVPDHDLVVTAPGVDDLKTARDVLAWPSSAGHHPARNGQLLCPEAQVVKSHSPFPRHRFEPRVKKRSLFHLVHTGQVGDALFVNRIGHEVVGQDLLLGGLDHRNNDMVHHAVT